MAEVDDPTRGRADRGPAINDALPVLWHLKVSNYNEKARWALDYKRIPHVRRAVVPGLHRRIAARLTGGRTFPILLVDGRAIGGSGEIIALLERRCPGPALLPRWGARVRALELAAYFDAQLGPFARLLLLDRVLRDRDLTLGAFAPDLAGARRVAARVAFPLIRRRVAAEFAIDDRGVARAYDALRSAGRRFGGEVGPSGYLVGAEFTVADLTLAALLAPLVAPLQFPYPQPQRGHSLLAPLREALEDAGLMEWTLMIYARHRGVSAEVEASRLFDASASAAHKPRL